MNPSIKSKSRVRPSLLWILIGCLVISLAALILLSEPKTVKEARVTITRAWERQIADLLRRRAAEAGKLADFDNRPVLQSAFGKNIAIPPCANSQGELVDYWKTPFQIRIVAQTNFVIRSAGLNKRFGDADDIVFDSISNDFVKP